MTFAATSSGGNAPTNAATAANPGALTNAPSASAPATNAMAGSVAPTEAPFVPVKPWAPPDVMPAQPHWVWVTSDGQEYDDVVVNKIEPETVSITHSLGVAHVAMATLTPSIQKRLNYDPAAAAAAKKEAEREEAHPYYRLALLEEAKAAARELHRPLAWMCGNLSALGKANPVTDSEDDLTQMAMRELKSRAIVIFLDGNGDLQQVAPVLLQQFYQYDDGSCAGRTPFLCAEDRFFRPGRDKGAGAGFVHANEGDA